MTTHILRVPSKAGSQLSNRAKTLGVSEYYILNCLVSSYLATPERFIVPIPVRITNATFPPS